MKLITTLIASILVISAASVIEASSSASFTTGESQQSQMGRTRFRAGLTKFSKRDFPAIPIANPTRLISGLPLNGGVPGGSTSAVEGKLEKKREE